MTAGFLSLEHKMVRIALNVLGLWVALCARPVNYCYYLKVTQKKGVDSWNVFEYVK